jgi:hypothetical protein
VSSTTTLKSGYANGLHRVLLEGLKPQRDLIADRGYDARAIIDWVESRVPAINSVYDAGQSLRTQRKRA